MPDTWILLLQRALGWTGEPRYAAGIEPKRMLTYLYGLHACRVGFFRKRGNIERERHPGNTLTLSSPFSVICQANNHVVALTHGSLVYAFFQDVQVDPVVFHDRPGLYPEDAVLVIDPAQPDDSVSAEPVDDGLLGPALRVSGHIQARHPVFATSKANAALPGQEEQPLLLLPFANQGAIRGENGVFMKYTRPGK